MDYELYVKFCLGRWFSTANR